MNKSHTRLLQSFTRQLHYLLTLRLMLQWVTLWLFVWGVAILVLRIVGVHNPLSLISGLFGIFPVIVFSVIHARRLIPDSTRVRASYDRLNACGGIVMAQETADMNDWLAQLPDVNLAKIRWRYWPALGRLLLSCLFVVIVMLLPERLTRLGLHRSLEISQAVHQLQAEVKTLAQDKIVDDKKAAELQKQLSQLQDDASGFDPDKTWEALDHIKQANADLAKQAADEALAKTESLAKAETVAKAMQQAADNGMDPATASQAAQDLANMLDSAKLEDGIFNNKIPAELLKGLNGLNQEQMQKLLQNLAANKDALKSAAADLANAKMIDAATLAQMAAAGQNYDPAALADYLSKAKTGGEDDFFSWLAQPGKGGPGGGGPPADMTWKDGSSEKDLKFQQHTLPPAGKLSDARIVAVSKAAPQLSGQDVATQHGSLDNASSGGGSSHVQLILPEQRQAVQNFFQRNQ